MSRCPRPDEVIGEIAGRQHGVVARAQLLAAGVGPDVLDRRLGRGQLRPLHRGVYLVGPLMTGHAREMAAILACGPAAVVSHGTAASLWGLLPPQEADAEVDISLRRGHRRRAGLRIRRVPTLQPGEVTVLDGIPLTTPARTLRDLPYSAPARDVERALAEAYARRLVTPEGMRKLLERRKGVRGSRPLRSFLEGHAPAMTRSEAEERFLYLVRKARLREPEVNVPLAGHEVDFLWRPERLVVEVDGFAYHRSSRAFETDRCRDADLAAAGMRVVRVTWRQIAEEPEALLVRLAQALLTRP